MKNLFKYKLFGLNILSEPELPELKAADFDRPDVKVLFSEVADDLPGYTSKGPLYKAKPGKFLFKLDTVGKYWVENGGLIKIERLNNSTDEEIRLFLLGSAFGALIHQRKMLPFHGSTVEKDGKAIIISGNSGAGKSTLAAVLIQRGYRLVADDISVIDFEEDSPIVYPGTPHLKLWQDVLKKLGDKEDYEKVRPQLLKFRKPVENALAKDPVQAEIIVVLGTKNSLGYEHKDIKGMEKFNVLKNNTYRFQFVEGLGTVQPHFQMVSRLAGKTRVIQVKRPSSPLMLNELADYFEEKVLT
ncbi:MAG: HPr kinase/phosphorylase [Bacteroidales bacterium]